MSDGASDQEIIQQVIVGDKSCYAILVRRYQQTAYKLALGILRHPADAEDAVSEALIKAFTALGNRSEMNNFRGWLLKITYNCCQDILRCRKKHNKYQSVENIIGDYLGESPLQEVMQKEQRQEVWRALAKLTTEEQTAVIMKYYSGASYQEISETLGWPMGTVASKLFRAREKLRSLISYGGDPHEH